MSDRPLPAMHQRAALAAEAAAAAPGQDNTVLQPPPLPPENISLTPSWRVRRSGGVFRILPSLLTAADGGCNFGDG